MSFYFPWSQALFFHKLVKLSSVVTHIKLERTIRIFAENLRRNICNTCLPLKSPTTGTVCLVARKRRSLNHILRNALALVISESRLCYYLRYSVLSNPASTPMFFSVRFRTFVCKCATLASSGSLPLYWVHRLWLQLKSFHFSSKPFYTYKWNRIHRYFTLYVLTRRHVYSTFLEELFSIDDFFRWKRLES